MIFRLSGKKYNDECFVFFNAKLRTKFTTKFIVKIRMNILNIFKYIICYSVILFCFIIICPFVIYCGYIIYKNRHSKIIRKRAWRYSIVITIGTFFYVITRGTGTYEDCFIIKSKSDWGLESGFKMKLTWISGLLLQIIGALFDFGALAFAPQSVVAPLGSLTLVINVFLAPIMHKEKATCKTMIATCIIILGCVITVIFSAKEDSFSSLNDVFNLYRSNAFYFYSVITGSYVVFLWLMIQYMVYLSKAYKDRYRQDYFKTHRFCIASLSGTMGAQNMLFAKAFSTLLVLTIQGKGMMFIHWQSYLVICALATTIYLQLRWLNSALKRYLYICVDT